MKLPQFTLREMFLLVVIAAMGCGWWLESTRLRQQIRKVNEEIEETSQHMMSVWSS